MVLSCFKMVTPTGSMAKGASQLSQLSLGVRVQQQISANRRACAGAVRRKVRPLLALFGVLALLVLLGVLDQYE